MRTNLNINNLVFHIECSFLGKKHIFRTVRTRRGDVCSLVCVVQKFLADECRGFMCQAPGQTANNERLMDSLYPTTTGMIPQMLSSCGPF